MLKSHIDAVESHLLSVSKIPANSGHGLHKGTPREAFIREFLANHLSQRASIGTGEIIDANSKPNENRHQFDIVIYDRMFPKLHFGGGIDGFLAESVFATIEVKSILDAKGLKQAIRAAATAKRLRRSFQGGIISGYRPPAILNYLVAYDGPVSVETVSGWLPGIHAELGITPSLLNTDAEQRINQPSPSVDGVFLLGRGFLYFDNVPFGFTTPEMRLQHPDLHLVTANTDRGSLLILFMLLTQALSGVLSLPLNPLPYLQDFGLLHVRLSSMLTNSKNLDAAAGKPPVPSAMDAELTTHIYDAVAPQEAVECEPG